MKEKWQIKEFYPGMHIRVKVNGFYHHGIYVGNDEVIQFGLPKARLQEASTVEVIKTSLKEFACNNEFIESYVYKRKELKKKRNDEHIVSYAYSHLGMKGYDILNYNCEHFANECVFGIRKSKQANDYKKKAS